MENRLELIRRRRSVRTFDGSALRPEDAERILNFARKVENPYELAITWRLLDVRRSGLTSPVITGAETFIAGKMRRAPHAEEAFGYTFEKVVLFAESLGLGTTWIAGTMDRPAFERAMALGEGEVMPCVSPLGRPAAKMSLRETLMRKGTRADTRAEFGALFFDGALGAPLSEEKAGELRPLLEAVHLAPSAVNKQPWRVVLKDGRAHFYEKRSRGYVNADGWDMQKIDMGIALCHFEIAAEECGVRARLELNDPGIPTDPDTAYIATWVIG